MHHITNHRVVTVLARPPTRTARGTTEVYETSTRTVYTQVLTQNDTVPPTESIQGAQVQESEQAGNTIITRDNGIEVSHALQPPTFGHFSSSEPSASFETMTNRWLALEPIEVKTIQARGSVLATYNFPEFLYQHYRDAIVLSPFANYIYSEIAFEIKFVVNVNKFHCGRLIASYRCDPYGYEKMHDNPTSALTRPHVLIDLATNVESVLQVPFKYHRSFIRNVIGDETTNSLRTGYAASVSLHVLSPLKTGDGAPNTVNVRPFIRLIDTRFYGMSYRVDFQMDTIRSVINSVAPPALRTVLRGIEIIHDTTRHNYDKPSDYTAISMVPSPTLGMSWGKGPLIACPLRLAPSAATTSLGSSCDGPQTTLELAQMWGNVQSNYWSATHKTGEVLLSLDVDPTLQTPNEAYTGTPTPLSLVCGMYNFWSGTIELRFDFISNAFHTGAVMICAEFGRTAHSSTTEWKSSQSSYTKTFHLGEQRSVSFIVPYIYDTIWRRSNAPPYDSAVDTSASTNIDRAAKPFHVVYKPAARVRMYVVNELRPPASTVQSIEILTFWRATPEFRVHSLCQSAYVSSSRSTKTCFPSSLTTVIADTAKNVNVKAKGTQRTFSDLLLNIGLGKTTAAIPKPDAQGYKNIPSNVNSPSTSNNIKGAATTQPRPERDLAAREEKEVHDIPHKEDLVYAANFLMSGRLPFTNEWIVDHREGIHVTRNYCEVISEMRNNIKHVGYVDDHPGEHCFPVYEVRDPTNYKADHLIAWIPATDMVAQTQMEYDGHDPTKNFRVGAAALKVQTTEDQTNIKDILRRPILLHEGLHVWNTWNTQGNIGFWIPITSPDFYAKPECTDPQSRLSSYYTPGLAATPQAVLTSLFRFWRGTSRYTVLVHDSLAEPVYVTYVPKSGVHLAGYMTSLAEIHSTPIYNGSLSTHIIIPHINPMLTVEVPFDSETQWCLTNVGGIGTNALPRDKTDCNVGHLVLSPTKTDRKISVWWSAGDDYELSNYYGIQEFMARSHMRSVYEDTMVAETQMDTYRSLKKTAKGLPNLVAKASTSFETAELLVNNIEEKVNGSVESVNKLTDNANTLMGKIEAKVDQVGDSVECLANTTKDTIKAMSEQASGLMEFAQKQLHEMLDTSKVFLNAGQAIVTVIKDLVLDISVAVVTRSWYSLGVAMLRSISTIISASIDSVLYYAQAIARWCQHHLGMEPQAQMEGSTTGSIAGILCGVIGTVLNVTVKQQSQYESFFQGCFESMTSNSGISYVNGVVRLVEKVFLCTSEIVKDCLAYMDPQARALRNLCKSSDEIDVFVKEAQRYTSAVNTSLLGNMAFRQRIWALVIQANMFHRAILMCPQTKHTNGLAAICKQVITFANENHIDLTCSPTRFEPFCFSLVGTAGIGKSHCVSTVCADLIASAGYNVRGSDLSYTRMPGSNFWDGYRNQPVIMYDDFGNMTTSERLSTQISELYQIKTTSEFIVNMASLTDKGMRGTPIVLALNANEDFPNAVANVCSDSQAVFRRRDELVKAELAEGYKGITRELVTAKPEVYKNYPHLIFRFHKDPSDPNAGYEPNHYTWLDFQVEMRRRFMIYYNAKMAMLKQRMKAQMSEVLGPYSPDRITDPYIAFWDLHTLMRKGDSDELPSDIIERAVSDIKAQLATLSDDSVEVFDDNVSCQGIGCVIAGFSMAALTNANATAYVASLFKKANAWLWKKGTDWHPTRVCTACGLTRQCALVCEGIEGNRHFICLKCASDCQEHCHICITKMRGALTPEGKTILASIAQFVVRLTSDANMTFGNLAKVWGSDIMKVFTIMTRLTMFVNLLNPVFRGASMAFMASHCLFTVLPTKGDPNYYHYFDDTEAISCPLPSRSTPNTFPIQAPPPGPQTLEIESIVETQGSSEEESFYDALDVETQSDPSSPKPSTSKMHTDFHINNCGVFAMAATYAQIIEHLSITEECLGPCAHNYLVENVDFAIYHKGKYRVSSTLDAAIMIPDRPCSDAACPFRTYSIYVEFLKQYSASHLPQLKQQFAACYNQHISPAVVLDNVPKLLVPSWVSTSMKAPEFKKLRWWEHISEFFSKYKKLLQFAGYATIALGSMAALWRFFPGQTKTPVAQSNIYDGLAARHIRQTARHVNIVRTKHATVQSETMLAQTTDKVVKNQVIMKVYRDGEVIRTLLLQGVYGSLAIFPKHYLTFIDGAAKDGCEFTIEPTKFLVRGANHLRHTYTYDAKDFIGHADTDLACMRLPKSYPLFKDIRSCFWTDKDILSTPLCYDAEIIAGPTSLRDYIKVAAIDIKGYKPMLSARDEEGSYVTNRDVLEYDYSEKGACGSLILSKHTTRPILAMHTAGLGMSTGYGTLVTKDLLDSFLPEEPVIQSEDVVLPPISDQAFVIDDLSVALNYLGEIPQGQRPHIPDKSKIKRSIIQDVGGLKPATQPAFLRQGEGYQHERSPLYYGVRKHGLRCRDFKRSLVTRAKNALWDGWFGAMPSVIVGPKRLTIHEAVTGFMHVPYYAPLKLTTSAGFPWSKAKGQGQTTKLAWIQVERDSQNNIVDCTIDPILIEEIQRKEALRKQGIVPSTIFVDTLKDERRAPEKVASAGGTRVFCSSPIDFTIAMRQNVLHFCAAMMNNRHQVMSAVGINPKGKEWTKVGINLAEKGEKRIFQLDYSNFGPAFNAVVAEAACDIITKWTMQNVAGVNEREIMSLLHECIQSTHIAGGTVYQQFCGSPSGASITTIINSVVNLLYVMIAWALIVDGKITGALDIWQVFRENVCIYVYGDDLIGSISAKYADIFNGVTISKTLGEYGIVATDTGESKKEAVPLYSLYEAEFLKRGFKPHPTREGLLLAPLRWTSINDATQWIWSSPDAKTATEINCEAALLEAHGHGPKRFEEFKNQVNNALSRKKAKRCTFEWTELDNKWFEEGLPDVGDGDKLLVLDE